jgi:hypothetical protein
MQDSSVCIAMGFGLDGQDLIPGKGTICRNDWNSNKMNVVINMLVVQFEY